MQDQPIENLGSNTNVPADSELLVLKNGTLQRATIEDVLKNTSINSALTTLNGNLKRLIQIKQIKATTGTTGNIAVGNTTADICVLGAYVNGYSTRIFVNNYGWFLKIVGIEPEEPLKSVEVTATIFYIKRVNAAID